MGPVGPRKLGRARVNADTSAEPEGLTRRVMLNILEAFFRRPLLHLLPLIVMIVLGGITAFGTAKEYRAVGTLTTAVTTVIGDITQRNPGVGFETPATVTARDINERLRTDRFLNLVAETANLGTNPDELASVRTEIAQSVFASAAGDRLVAVAATTAEPQLAADLAAATIGAYRGTVLANEQQASQEAEDFLQGAAEEIALELAEAEAALDEFLANNPVASTAELPPTQQVEFGRLSAVVARAESRYASAQDAVDEAARRGAQAQIDVSQRLQLQDEAQAPTSPQPRLKKALLTLVLFGVLGVGLSLTSVVASATLDRTIRLPNDVSGRFGLDVLAVVPDVRRR